MSLYAILAILLLACTISAQAGQLEVVPVLVEMQASAMSTTLTVFNHGKDKTTVQIRAFNWVQDVTGDVLSRSGIVLVSPPIAEIPGDSSQIFRILLRQPPTVTEAAYRIVLDELPSQQAFGTVQFSLRISLPMFAKPVAVTSAHLQWRAEPDGRDGAEIIATNHGTAAERVVGLGVTVGAGQSIPATALADPWVLPGAERRWHVALQHPVDWRNAAQVQLTGHLRQAPLNVAAPIISAQ